MSAATRFILILTLMFALTGGAWAQEETTTTTTTTGPESATTTAATEESATAETTGTAATTETTGTATGTKRPPPTRYETRNQLTRLLQAHSHELATVLALEPSLLANEEFLKGHPELAEFVATRPEVAQHPDFYLSGISPRRNRGAFDEILESLQVLGVFVFIAAVLAWFIRTVIEQKRWSRLSKQQAEVHNKILDRFGKTEELMEYIKTPAGTKFLESAPIPLHAERATPSTPQSRVLLSIQIGVVVAAGALGMLLVSFRFDRETAADLFALGTIGFCVGIGFIASALISLFLSRRLGSDAPSDVQLVK